MGGMSARSSRTRSTAPSAPAGCPCDPAVRYADCCGRLHSGQRRAATPQELMRSRYSAFAVGDEAYLLRTWHPSTRPPAVRLERGTRWVRLEILGGTGGGAFHSEGTVEFRAHFRDGSRPGTLHEDSRFVHHEGAWVYLDGTVSD